MQKPLISLTCMASLLLVACSTGDVVQDDVSQHSILERIPLVYRQDIQQGNVLTQDMVNQLRPGLSKQQVRFIMGTPMLVDVFHQDRWDYLYTMARGWGEMEEKRIHLYFKNGHLERIEGDFKPDPQRAAIHEQKDTIVNVPDYIDPNRGIIERAVDKVGDLWRDEATP